MEHVNYTSANDESMTDDVLCWIGEVEMKLKRLEAQERRLTRERAQYIRTLRWLHSLGELDD